MSERSTVKGIRGSEWHISKFGLATAYDACQEAGSPTLLQEAREKVDHILQTHQPLPLGEDAERELQRIQERVQAEG